MSQKMISTTSNNPHLMEQTFKTKEGTLEKLSERSGRCNTFMCTHNVNKHCITGMGAHDSLRKQQKASNDGKVQTLYSVVKILCVFVVRD